MKAMFMTIPSYTKAIKEGLELADVRTNFLLFSEKNMYGDFPFEDGCRAYQDVYRKPIPKGFSERRGPFNIKTGLRDEEKKSLELPPEYDPIVLFTKGRTVNYLENLSKSGLVKKESVDYVRQMTPEEFGKMLIVTSFHEGSHRKYDTNYGIKILRKHGLHTSVNPKTDGTVISHVPIIMDELGLAEKKPDLRPIIANIRDGNTDPPYVKAYELAMKMV